MVRREGERPAAWMRWRQDELWAAEAARGRNPRIRRWIGAARRRAQRMQREAEAGSAQVITLTWAQTFGRPSSPRTNAVPLLRDFRAQEAHAQESHVQDSYAQDPRAQDSLPEDRTVILLRRG